MAFLEGDIHRLALVEGEFSDILHMAAETTYPPGGVSSGDACRSAIAGAMGVLDLSCRCGARRLLLTSSGAVYGPQPADCARVGEDARLAPATDDPASGYAQGKRLAEFLCADAAAQRGLEAKIARCFAFVGPVLPLDANYAIGNFVADALRKPFIDVQSDGTARRSYLYASDLAVWLWIIIVRGEPARPYNVGSPDDVSIGDLARRVAATLAPDKTVHIALAGLAGRPTVPVRAGHVSCSRGTGTSRVGHPRGCHRAHGEVARLDASGAAGGVGPGELAEGRQDLADHALLLLGG